MALLTLALFTVESVVRRLPHGLPFNLYLEAFKILFEVARQAHPLDV